MANLVIVESPSKAKTIEKYLGGGYSVKASMGHLRDLPKSKMGIDIQGGFIPDYQPIKGKEAMIRELHEAAKRSEKVFLATDPDREGEAISWHLKELLEIPDDKAYRVTFNEITKKVVTEAINHPRQIDMDLVDAQQARRILDRIVGYELSPLLWRKIRRGLSAGRVQSVATRLVVDRENEIRNFIKKEYWTIDAELSLKSGHTFKARFFGTPEGKIELTSEEDTIKVLNAVKEAPFSVYSVKNSQKRRSPSPPFITSTLQQEASRRHGMQARRTMAVAQQLYEGVDIKGLGSIGLITYMRTDSLRLSDEATAAAREYIGQKYGKEFVPKSARQYKTKSGAQDAHEAIRPSDITLEPDAIRASLNADQYRLYKLIWSRMIACQMENAVYDTQSIEAISAGYIFKANSQRIRFAGFTAVYEEQKDEPEDDAPTTLPEVDPQQPLNLGDISSEQHFTQPPPRYTEATLIRAMEEKGIGRPSTYAPTVTTIQDRDYVLKEQKYLRPTPLGEVVTKLMEERFNQIIDVGFTAKMEEDLDLVGEGKESWKNLLAAFYKTFSQDMASAEEALATERIKVPDEETDVVCELCGRNMVIKNGRFGRFLACPGFPECKNTKAITETTPGICPKCEGRILKKKSKNGYTYYGCENFPKCDFMTWDVPVEEVCRECGKTMFKRSGKGANKPFCANPECSLFLPEDKRGYRRKPGTADNGAPTEGAVDNGTNEQSDTKKSTSKTGTAASKKKTAAKTAAKKPTSKKPTAKKTTAKKTGAAAKSKGKTATEGSAGTAKTNE